MLAPAHTDRRITELLAKETSRVLALQEFRDRWEPTGTVLVGSTPAEFGKVIRNDYERWKKVVQASGTKAE